MNQIALTWIWLCYDFSTLRDHRGGYVKKLVEFKENLPRFCTMPLLTDSMAASESALFFAERAVTAFVKTFRMLSCSGKKDRNLKKN